MFLPLWMHVQLLRVLQSTLPNAYTFSEWIYIPSGSSTKFQAAASGSRARLPHQPDYAGHHGMHSRLRTPFPLICTQSDSRTANSSMLAQAPCLTRLLGGARQFLATL